jgi:hypothetical protein
MTLPAGTYNQAQTVKFSDTTPSVTFYYTTDGTTPTAASNKYSGSITVNGNQTVKAIAVLGGFTNSAVAATNYSFTAATPVFSVAPGDYTNRQFVGITDATPGVTIYYTTNGTTPTTASPKYSVPIEVRQTEMVKAIAVLNGYTTSQPASGKYTLNVPVVKTWPPQTTAVTTVKAPATDKAADIEK